MAASRPRGTRGPVVAWFGGCVALLSTLAGCGSPESTSPREHDPGVYPYLEVASAHPQDLAGIRADARADGLTLAFVIAGRGCRPIWSRGGRDATDPAVRSRVAALRASGTPVRISFGGAGGTDLASGCDSVEALTAAYRAVVDAYRPDGIDLDVEGRALADGPGNARRVVAVRAAQRDAARAGYPFQVSYTLPAGRNGVTAAGVKLLVDSVAAEISVSAVNVMIMNYGWGVTDLGDEAVRQARLVHQVIQRLWPGLSESDAWQRVALTAMIGHNDVPGEVFHPADARTVARFAADRGVGWLSYWSMERDRACPQPPPAQPSGRCSGVAQRPYQFADILLDQP